MSRRDVSAMSVDDLAPLPNAFEVLASIVAASEEAVASGAFRVVVRGYAGPSGVHLLARFCHADPVLEHLVLDELRAEEALDPSAIHAEIVHLPVGRAGNVVIRPLLRDHEIVILGRLGAPTARQIPVSDLFVSVRESRVLLRSGRLERRVVPQLTCAHGATAALAGRVRPAVDQLAAKLLDGGRLWRFQLDTYEREVERYGGPEGVEVAEGIFHADSDAVLEILDALEPGDEGADERWRLGPLGSAMLLEDLGLSLEQRRSLMSLLRGRLRREFRADAALSKGIGNRFRAERADLERLVALPPDDDHLLAPGVAVLTRRSERLEPMVARLHRLEDAGPAVADPRRSRGQLRPHAPQPHPADDATCPGVGRVRLPRSHLPLGPRPREIARRATFGIDLAYRPGVYMSWFDSERCRQRRRRRAKEPPGGRQFMTTKKAGGKNAKDRKVGVKKKAIKDLDVPAGKGRNVKGGPVPPMDGPGGRRSV